MRLIQKLALICCSLALLAGCAAGRSAFDKGQDFEQEGKLDEAVLKYAEATQADPGAGEYRLHFLKAREKAARDHFNKAEEFMAEQKYAEALQHYQAALALDPSLDRAAKGGEKARDMVDAQQLFKEGADFEKNNKPRDAYRSYKKALELNPEFTDAREAMERLLKSKRPKMDGYELNLKSNKPITLKFKDTRIKDVFNILSQLSGINFIFDEGLKDQNINIYLENATFQQALEILTNISKLGKKVLNESTIIIYPKTPEKGKQYEELVVQTFVLNHLDAKKAVNLLRTMLQLKKIFVNEDLNAIVVRDTPDVVEVAQKILEANDMPDAEVLLEVEVIELSKSNTDSFGLGLSAYSASIGLAQGGNILSDGLKAGGSTTGLLNPLHTGSLSSFITVPTATYNFSKTVANGETLANPKIRVKNREKAKFNVGTRLPITTTSTNGTVGGVNVNVQYVDVGVKLNAEPTIQLSNEISMKVSLEVSFEISRDKIGTDQVTVVSTIGTRNLDTVLSLRDGETSIIGGLIQDSKKKSNKKIFLIGDIPFLGPLLSGYDDSNDKTELVLAITPRLVRSVSVPDSDLAQFWSGREDEPSAAKPNAAFIQEPELAGEAPTAKGAPSPQPVKNEPAVAPPAAPEPNPAFAPAPAQPQPQPSVQGAPAKAALNLIAPVSVKIGEQFAVEVKGGDLQNLYSAPFTLTYDPLFLDFVGVTEGGMLKQDGKPTAFQSSVDPATGRLTVSLSRVGQVGGVSGSGTLVTAQFRAKKAGPASLGLQNLNFTAAGGAPLEMLPYSALVEIK